MQHDAHVQTRCRGGKAVESLKANLGFHVDLATGSVMTGADDVGPESRKKKGARGRRQWQIRKKRQMEFDAATKRLHERETA